jgi:hypothetical protein
MDASGSESVTAAVAVAAAVASVLPNTAEKSWGRERETRTVTQ